MSEKSTIASDKRPDARSVLKRFLSIFSLLLRMPATSIGLVAIIVTFVFWNINNNYLQANAVQDLLLTTSFTGLLAIGEAMLMITGEIDLSVANIYNAVPFITYFMTQWLPIGFWSYILAFVVSMIGAALIGFINGFLTVKMHIPSLIATLGMLFVLNGITQWVSNSTSVIMPVVEPINTFLGAGQQSTTIGGLAPYAGIMYVVIITLALTVVLRRTRFGAYTIAVGSSILAAREIGIHTDRIKISNFMIVSMLAGFAGIMHAVTYTSASPSAADGTTTLTAIAAAVIGGTSLFGGSGTIVGALIGAFVVIDIRTGLPFIGASAGVSDIPLGLAIIGSMMLNNYFNRSRTRS